MEDLNHASLDANELYNIYLGGHHSASLNTVLEQMANAIFDIVFAHGTDESGRYPGRVNGAYEGKYCDGYVRDNFMELLDIRKDWYEKVISIDQSLWPGSLPMMGKLLWCKSRRIDAPANIVAQQTGNGLVTLSWMPAEGTVTILRSDDLWTWTTVTTVNASTGTYTDNNAGTSKVHYYRLVRVNNDEAGYSELVTTNN